MVIKIPKSNGRITEEQREEIIRCARELIGVRWHHMGRNRMGLDCAGLLVLTVYEAMGAWVEVSDYSPWPRPAQMRHACNQILRPKQREELTPGDVVLLYVPGLGVVHLGWFTGDTIIHSCSEPHARKVVETPISKDWNLRKVYEVPCYQA